MGYDGEMTTQAVEKPVEETQQQQQQEEEQRQGGEVSVVSVGEQETVRENGGGNDEGEERGRWSSKWAFILAAIGSAVGLGNFWRFPYLVYRHGGGPFLIPYTMALFAIGIPMLLLELSMGQKFQSGDVAAFGRIHGKLRGVGYASVFASFIVASYYLVIITWTAVYLVESFWMPWKGDAVVCANGNIMERPTWHFQHEVLGLIDAQCRMVDMSVGGSSTMSGTVAGALVGTWALVGGSVLYGVKSASMVVWITMPLPFVLALMLFFRAVTLEGAGDGIKAYIGTWDMGKLREPEIWTDAVSQIFFSLSVCFGVMTSYGSYRPADRPVLTNVLVISITNCLFSFFCGFIVFGVLGYMASERTSACMVREQCAEGNVTCAEGCVTPVDEVVRAGVTLVFDVFPTALATMGNAGYFFSVATFATLFTLGWDSAFSLLEAITTVIMDAPFGEGSVREALERRVGERFALPLVTVGVSVLGLLAGLLYTADVGLIWLDVVDHYASNYVMLLDGLLQSVAVGWVWGVPAMAKRAGKESAMWFVGGAGVAGAALVGLTAGLAVPLAPCETDAAGTETCYTGGELGIGFTVALVGLTAAWARSFLVSGLTVREWISTTFFAGAEELMDYVCIVGHEGGVALGEGRGLRDFFGSLFRVWWMFCIKYLSPVVLTFLVVLMLKKDSRSRYEGYQRWINNTAWGCTVVVSLVIFTAFIILPGKFGAPVPNPDPKELYIQQQKREREREREGEGEQGSSPNEPVTEA